MRSYGVLTFYCRANITGVFPQAADAILNNPKYQII